MRLRKLLFWFFFGILIATGMVMATAGILFIHTVLASPLCGAGIFCSLLFGVLLLLTGIGLVSSTIVGSVQQHRRQL